MPDYIKYALQVVLIAATRTEKPISLLPPPTAITSMEIIVAYILGLLAIEVLHYSL